MNDLARRLDGLSPADYDRALSAAYRSLLGTDGHQALEIVLARANKIADQALIDPRSSGEVRAFWAGARHVLAHISAALQAGFNFDPDNAEYSPEPPAAGPDAQMTPPAHDIVY